MSAWSQIHDRLFFLGRKDIWIHHYFRKGIVKHDSYLMRLGYRNTFYIDFTKSIKTSGKCAYFGGKIERVQFMLYTKLRRLAKFKFHSRFIHW